MNDAIWKILEKSDVIIFNDESLNDLFDDGMKIKQKNKLNKNHKKNIRDHDAGPLEPE